QAPAEFARAVIEEKLAGPAPSGADSPYARLPRHDPAELEELARRQGAPVLARFEDLLGDFWPDEESADEFLASLREWREDPRAPELPLARGGGDHQRVGSGAFPPCVPHRAASVVQEVGTGQKRRRDHPELPRRPQAQRPAHQAPPRVRQSPF